MTISITVQADFTPEEALAILQKVRDVDQGRPDMDMRVLVKAPEMTLEDSRNFLRRVNPPFKYWTEVGTGDTFLRDVSGNGDPC